MNYIKNAIGSAAYRAMAQNCGISSYSAATLADTPAEPWIGSQSQIDLDANVAAVIAACLANSTFSGLGADSAGSINVECARAATAAALANNQITVSPAPEASFFTQLAVNIATLFTAWKTNIVASISGHVTTNYLLNAIGAGAYEALSINRGVSSGLAGLPQSTSGAIETDLDDQVAAIIAACHANVYILALEGNSEGSVPVVGIRAAVLAVFSNLGTDGISPSGLTTLAALVYTIYERYIPGTGSPCQYEAAAAAVAAMGANTGITSASTASLAILYDNAFAYKDACQNDATFAALDDSSKGDVQLSTVISGAISGTILNLTAPNGTITFAGSYVSVTTLLNAINAVVGWTGIASDPGGVLLLTDATGLTVVAGTANAVLGLEQTFGSATMRAIEAATTIVLQGLDIEAIVESVPSSTSTAMAALITLVDDMIAEILAVIQ